MSSWRMVLDLWLTVLPLLCIGLGALFGAMLGRHGKDPHQRRQIVPRGDLVGAAGFSLTAVLAWVSMNQADLDPGLSFLPMASLLVGLMAGIIFGITTGARH